MTTDWSDRRLEEAERIIENQKRQIGELERQLHKAQSVLESVNDWRDIIDQSHQMKVPSKKQAISAQTAEETDLTPLKAITEERDLNFILEAFTSNEFFRHLESSIIRILSDFMYEVEYGGEEVIMEEGESGNKLFLLKRGRLAVIKEKTQIGVIAPGTIFGELALIYNCPRTATVKTLERSSLVVLDQTVFKNAMMRTEIREKHQQVQFLRQLPIMANLSHTKLTMLANCLDQESFCRGDTIVQQGKSGDTFYIIREGSVKVVQDDNFVRKLGPGEYFGEQAILEAEERTASVICLSHVVECYTLDRKTLRAHVDKLKLQANESYVESPLSSPKTLSPNIPDELIDAQLSDLEPVATLGIGGFGRVELVKLGGTQRTYALKCVSKKYVVKTSQQKHIIQEKEILMGVSNPFIIKLYKTFKDDKMVYFLMEAALGGELWTILRNRNRFSNDVAKFCLGSVILALEYLHERRIVYRDLKPENIMLNSSGYLVLIDFGFAKKIPKGEKTYTFCGTPEYVAPEVILNKGHDFAVDIWGLGILTFELITGTPPFVAREPMLIYKQTFRGLSAMNFPRYFHRKAIKFIESTCKIAPFERLGYGCTTFRELRNSQWFHNLDWARLQDATLKTLIPTIVASPTDTANFDRFSRSMSKYEPEFSGWDDHF